MQLRAKANEAWSCTREHTAPIQPQRMQHQACTLDVPKEGSAAVGSVGRVAVKHACCCRAGPGLATDLIALYSPGNVNPAQFLFVKYITGNQITGYVGTGKGTYV